MTLTKPQNADKDAFTEFVHGNSNKCYLLTIIGPGV